MTSSVGRNINEDEETLNGVLPIDQNILLVLKSKHHTSKDTGDLVLLKGEVPFTNPVVFNNNNESSIAKAVLRTKSAAGPQKNSFQKFWKSWERSEISYRSYG